MVWPVGTFKDLDLTCSLADKVFDEIAGEGRGRGKPSVPFSYMKISLSKSLLKSFPQVLLVFSLLLIYLNVLAPGLTWANDGSDGGDLIAAAATGGVAHPTGYPLYLLLARLFQYLPVGSLAFRTNLMSALATALAAGLLYSIVTVHLSATRPVQYWPAGMAAGYAFGLAPLIWSQAVITEVYALQALLTLLILYLYTRPASHAHQNRLNQWRGLTLGLGVGNHVTTMLVVPAALLISTVYTDSEWNRSLPAEPSRLGNLMLDRASLVQQLAWFCLGLCLYLMIPLRALAQPPINWGNPVTLERFWWLASGQLYQSRFLQFNLSGLWERIQAWAALLLEQFGLAGLLMGSLGLVVFGSRSRFYALTAWIAAVSLVFAVFYRSDDSYVYLIPMFIAFSIWIGLGIAGLVTRVSQRFPTLGVGLGLLALGYFAGRSVVYVNQVDASGDLRAEAFGRKVLSVVPENAMIFAKGDRAVFTLWYFHFALRERPDLAVMASDLLHFDWYQENLQSTYPSLVVPGPFPWPETMTLANPSRPTCYVQYSGQTEIDCAQPLTTP
jgi:hypothetical protein